MFLIRIAFWVALIVLLLPSDKERQAQLYRTASDAVHKAATFCDRGGEVPATEQDRQLQVVAVARRVLVASGVEAALVSRSGTDLSRFQLQYSHSGLALKDSRNGP